MNSADLSKILEEHKVWITSMRESGSRADLRDADLFGANLCGADLRGADLRDADLFGADLLGANLCGANLRGANLCGANLRGANLCGANLRGANLCGADLPDLTFVILGEKYFISITNGEYVRAGCQNHTVEEWRKYSKQEIAEMDGRKALKFYPRLLDIIDFYIGKGERPDWLTSKEYADEVTE
ncbi:pentapeptide repeat-containing protein [Salmonella enterica]|nr:pentapeptide repeat-containing protein [Salmonella enterica]EHG3237757.1 pentapeptide repeat-containing protein [Salmonella enterica]